MCNNPQKEYKNYLKGILYNNPTLWLFLPNNLFYEQAKINILRYKSLLNLPKEYDETSLNLLLNDKQEKTLNKWTQDYINIIKVLKFEKMLFNFPLEDTEKKHLWLEFLCFILKLYLRTQPNFDRFNYDIFSSERDLQLIVKNLLDNSFILKDGKYDINFFITLITNNLSLENDTNISPILEEALLYLGNYTNVNKPTLKPSQAIMSILLHLILLKAYITFGSFENISIYIKENIFFEKDRASSMIRQNSGLFTIFHLELALDNINATNPVLNNDKLLGRLTKTLSKEKDKKSGITLLPLFKMLYDIRKELFYTYLTKTYTEIRDAVQKELQDLEEVLYRTTSHEEFFKLLNILHNKRERVPEKYKYFEKKRLDNLDKAIILFWKGFNKIMIENNLNFKETLGASNLNFTALLEDSEKFPFLAYQKNLVEKKSLYYNPKAPQGSRASMEFVTLPYEEAYPKYITLDYSPRDDFRIYIYMLNTGLDKILFNNDSFASQIFSIISFSYEYLKRNVNYASEINDHITSYLSKKIYYIFCQHLNKIRGVLEKKFPLMEKENYSFSFKDKKELLMLFIMQNQQKHRELLSNIYSFALFKEENITNNESALKDCFEYFLQKGFNIKENYLKLISKGNSLRDIIKILGPLLDDVIAPHEEHYFINMVLLLFFGIYKNTYTRGLDFYPLNTRENIEILFYEISHFEEVTSFQILDPTMNYNVTMYSCFNDKSICNKTAPVIQEILPILNNIYDINATTERFGDLLLATILQLTYVALSNLEKPGIEFLLLCSIKWLLYDFKKVQNNNGGVYLERLTIKKPSTNKEKINLDIVSILNYISNLEKTVTNNNMNLDSLYNSDSSRKNKTLRNALKTELELLIDSNPNLALMPGNYSLNLRENKYNVKLEIRENGKR